MKTIKLILLGLACITALSATAQSRNKSRSEKKAHIERAVKESIDLKQYKINVNHMQPMSGRSRALTSNYSIEVRNDSVFSYLPYFGVSYSAPYGGGKGLIFNAPISEYKTEQHKKGKVVIDFSTRNEEDNYKYNLTFYPNGSASIHVQPTKKQPISFTGEMDIKE